MGLILRVMMGAGGALAALFVARDAPNFQVVQAMMALVALAAGVLVVALATRR